MLNSCSNFLINYCLNVQIFLLAQFLVTELDNRCTTDEECQTDMFCDETSSTCVPSCQNSLQCHNGVCAKIIHTTGELIKLCKDQCNETFNLCPPGYTCIGMSFIYTLI